MGIGKRIKEARERLGMTQNELAEIVGVTGSAITNYEKETSHPKEPIMYKLFDALHVDANYLFQDVVNIPKKVNDVTISEFEIIKKFRKLDPPGQEHIISFLDWEVKRTEQLKQAKIPADKLPLRLIQYYQRLASAGTGQYIFDDVPSEQIEIPDIPEYKKVRYALGVNGRSMEPDFLDGEIVLVEPVEEVELGEIGIFISEGDAFIKKRGKDFLISLNKPTYKDIPLSASTRCIGRVIGKLESKV